MSYELASHRLSAICHCHDCLSGVDRCLNDRVDRVCALALSVRHTKLVALWIGHDCPLEVPLVFLIDQRRSQAQQSFDLHLRRSRRFEIQVDTVFDALSFGYPEKHQHGMALRQAITTHHCELRARGSQHLRSQSFSPKCGQGRRVHTIKRNVHDMQSHTPSVATRQNSDAACATEARTKRAERPYSRATIVGHVFAVRAFLSVPNCL